MFEKVILIHFVKLPRKILKFTLEVKKDNIKKIGMIYFMPK